MAGEHRPLAARIAELRQARGWKQRELSQRSGIAPDRLSRLERGAQIRVEELVALCRAFGIGVDDLLFGTATGGGEALELVTRALQRVIPAKDLPALEWLLRTLAAGCRALQTG